ncbi:MAG: formate C-acetyltransferase/glycerol dehydratase family glycyl radical enzyme [Candidatus Hodarchaeota archaeon]
MSEKLLNELVRETPHLSLTVPLCYTKILKETYGKPMIIRQAEGLKYTLESLPIIIRPDELIVGTFDEKIPVAIPRPEATGLRIMREIDILSERLVNPIKVNEEDIKIMKEEIAPFYENFRVQSYANELAPNHVFEILYRGLAYISTEAGGIAHAVIDYQRLIKIGLMKYLKLSEENIKKYEQLLGIEPRADEKIAFYKSMKVIIKAIIDFAKKYSKKATVMANQETDPSRKKELLRIAETCNNVPENPASNLHEAIQFVWFIHMILHIENFEHGISFGRLDQYLFQYYNGDSEEAVRLFKNLILKTNEIIALYDSFATQYFGGMATTQCIVIGGMDVEGNDVSNELTYLILDAHEEASVASPNIVIRCHSGTPNKLYRRVTNIIADGKNILALYNDDVAIKCLLTHKIPIEDARNYGIVGCVGLSTSGLSYDNTGAIFLSLPKALEITLGTDTTLVSKYVETAIDPKSFKSIDDVLDAYRKNLKIIIEMAVTAANAYQQAHIELKPTPLMSLSIRGCFEEGIDINKGSAKYNFSGIHVTGLSDLVDSLAAIDYAVFKEKVITIEQLIHALRKNFRGKKELRNYLQNRCPKYGCDNDHVDNYTEKIGKILVDSVKDLKCARGGEYRAGIHAMTTHVGFGIFTGALPSGRKKGEALTKDIAPSSRGEKALTSAINSATKLDHSLITNGLACTLNIIPEIARMDDGKIFEALIRSYFERGGLHLQFNAISYNTLLDAQQNPEIYGDLMIRVSGYSARFIDLPKSVQNEIIQSYLYENLEIQASK